jgi:hypothetical protein
VILSFGSFGEHIRMSDSHAAHGDPVPSADPFNDAEWQDFRRNDIRAGGAIVALMGCIFTIGVVLYSFVLYFVMKSPHM